MSGEPKRPEKSRESSVGGANIMKRKTFVLIHRLNFTPGSVPRDTYPFFCQRWNRITGCVPGRWKRLWKLSEDKFKAKCLRGRWVMD